MKIKCPWKTLPGSHLTITANAVVLNSAGKFMGQKAALEFPSSSDTFQPLPLTWKWGTAAKLVITAKIAYEIITPGSGIQIADVSNGSFSFIAVWKIYYDDSELVLHYEGERDLGSSGKGIFAIGVQPREYQSASQAALKTVTLVLGVVAGYTTDGIEIGLSHPKGGGVSTKVGGTSKRYSRDYDLTVQCRVVDKPVEAVVVPPGLLEQPVYFKKDKTSLADNQLSDLKNWYIRLQDKAPALHAAIRDGICPLTLAGYASTPGTKEHNIKVSNGRIAHVKLLLEQRTGFFESRKLRIFEESYGEARTLESGENDAEQRVEIWIKPADAKKAIRGAKKPVN